MTETNEHALRKLKLTSDIVLYAAGGVPSDDEMARSPRIEDWRVVNRVKPVETMLDRCMSIVGKVHNRANIADGERITTSAVVWFDRHSRFVRTINRLYALGEPAESGDDR